jgi:hypothetical protein
VRKTEGSHARQSVGNTENASALAHGLATVAASRRAEGIAAGVRQSLPIGKSGRSVVAEERKGASTGSVNASK